MALLLTKQEPGNAALRSLQTMGIPFFATHDLDAALRHRLIFIYPSVDHNSFSEAEAARLIAFVADGGSVFAQNVFWGGLKPIFGFDGFTPSRTRHQLSFQGQDKVLLYLDQLEERHIQLGSPELKEVIWSNGYKAAPGAMVLAEFEDGSAAMLQKDTGKGHAYLIGVSLEDVVLRPQQNRDYEAQRVYANGFEPAGDVWPLLLRAFYEAYSPIGLRLHTIPNGKRSVLMLSHDVDWEYSIGPVLELTELERAAGAASTFFVQTKYSDDVNSRAFFYGANLGTLRRAQAAGADIGSHTIIHTLDFNLLSLGTGEETYADYRPRATIWSNSYHATTLGEVCVSKSLLDGNLARQKTIFFRAGHLSVPPYLPEALQRCGYDFDSSFTANDVMTNFPYRLYLDLGMTESAEIFEFPVTIEDEQKPPLRDRIGSALRIITANADNGAPNAVLIHSNNSGEKWETEKKLLSALPKDIAVTNMTTFADFWKARDQVRWQYAALPDGSVRVQLTIPSRISGLTLSSPRPVLSVNQVDGAPYAEASYTAHSITLPALEPGTVAFIIRY